MRRVAIQIVGLLTCGYAAAAGPMFPLPQGAQGFRHVSLQANINEQDSFLLAEAFPDTSAVVHYGKLLSGWRLCERESVTWQSFGDESKIPKRFVHQVTRHWVSPANDAVVTLALMYYSPGSTYRQRPIGDEQHVVVLRLKTSDAKAFLSGIEVECGGT
jgi:hypothetical protein